MGKTNWTRVFLGGLVAGIVLNILNILEFTIIAIYVNKTWQPGQETVFWTFWIIFYFIVGIIVVWLYSAIRPRYGEGAKTAIIAGFASGVLMIAGLTQWEGVEWVNLVTYELFSHIRLWPIVITALVKMVMMVVATLAGAWVYKEQE